MAGALLTDLYELNMAASYLRRDMGGLATFSLYVRGLPKKRGFLVAAGLEASLDFLETVSFEDEDLAYLSSVGFDDRALEDFRALRFDGEVWAVPEGRIVYSEEPILEVTAPVAVGQLVETYLLNQITLHTTLATKAARYVIAADGHDLVDFAFRRTHGTEAAMAVARASAMVGFAATSNVEAARRFGLTVAGTMAHAYIEAFDSEREAFRAFAQDNPARTTFLVDTYDALNGVRNAIETIRELGLDDQLGVRLDSGDLDSLARGARELLDAAGLTDARIFASGGLDELEVAELVKAGAPVDAFGVGTQMGVSADAPYVDSVYKLTEYDGEPKLKLSAAKASAPGRKQVWRSGAGDLLALRDEEAPDGGEAMLAPVMRDGKRLAPSPGLDESRARFRTDVAAVPAKARRLTHPEHVVVPHSAALRALTVATRAEAMRRSVEGA
ncbi:MAG: nicotinate phosphoribosyltransferase [Actinomycetota bacterium]